MKNLPKWVYGVWIIAIFALAFSIMAIFMRVIPQIICEVHVVSISIILGFVGILATFVVINNYSQTQQIKTDAKSDIDGVNNKFENTIKEVEKMKEHIKGIKKGMSEIEYLEFLKSARDSLESARENIKNKKMTEAYFDYLNSITFYIEIVKIPLEIGIVINEMIKEITPDENIYNLVNDENSIENSIFKHIIECIENKNIDNKYTYLIEKLKRYNESIKSYNQKKKQ